MIVASLSLSSDQELQRKRSSNWTHFLPIKNLDLGHKGFNRQHISDNPLNMLPIAGQHISSVNVTNQTLIMKHRPVAQNW